MSPETGSYLQKLQPLLSMPRETVPQLTVVETRDSLRWAAESLELELIEIKGVAPTFLLLPPAGRDPGVLLFGTWHAEALPVDPAAVEGAERLALSAALAGLGRSPEASAAVVVAPGATQGSIVLAQTLREHRARLRAPVAFWPRITPRAPRRRRVFLGARGRVVLGVWEAGVNPYRIRDRIVEELKAEAYGPRPLDFELLHKLGQSRDALDFLEETLEDPGAKSGEGEARLARALFEPRGQVVKPQVSHPDRPQAWLILDVSENADPDELLDRARRYAEGSRIEMAEGFPWDRISIHHPSIQAEIKLTKTVSEGPEIWPAAPWLTPSGVFSRALGVPLAEWGVPVHPGVAVRFPKPEDFEALAGEVEGLIRGALSETWPT
jgi:hypothetical protein